MLMRRNFGAHHTTSVNCGAQQFAGELGTLGQHRPSDRRHGISRLPWKRRQKAQPRTRGATHGSEALAPLHIAQRFGCDGDDRCAASVGPRQLDGAGHAAYPCAAACHDAVRVDLERPPKQGGPREGNREN